MIEKFRQHAQEQKTKIEDLGIIQQKRGGKRKRKNYWKEEKKFVDNTNQVQLFNTKIYFVNTTK